MVTKGADGLESIGDIFRMLRISPKDVVVKNVEAGKTAEPAQSEEERVIKRSGPIDEAAKNRGRPAKTEESIEGQTILLRLFGLNHAQGSQKALFNFIFRPVQILSFFPFKVNT